MNEQGSIHTSSGTPGARRSLPGRRVLQLAAPVVIGVLVLALALNVLTASAFGDLVVTISGLSHDPANPTQVTAGTVTSFTVMITNTSSSVNPAEAVEFQYRAPEVVVVHISSSVGWCEVGTPGDPGDPSICSLGNMPSGRTETVTIVVYVPSNLAEGTLLDHDVRAWQFGTEENPPNNEDHGWMGVVTEADLEIIKTDDPDPVIAGDLPASAGGVIDGDLLKYTLTVTNTGPSDARSVVVTDTLPVDAAGEPQVVFLNSTLTDFVGADQCSADPIHPEKVTCEVGTMTVSQTVGFDMLVFVNPDVVQAGEAFHTITNTAEVQSPTTDPDTGNNVVTQDTRVEAKADLTITKADTPDPVVAGQQVAYTISFVNQGPSTARTVTITDVLPAKIRFSYCAPIDPDDVVECTADTTAAITETQMVTLTRLLTRRTEQFINATADLDPGEGYAFAIVADVESGYVLDKGVVDPQDPSVVIPENPPLNPDNPALDTAYIASETTSGVGDYHPDVNPDDNQDTEQTVVTAQADLKVSKTDTPDPTLPDAYLTYDPVTNKFVYTYTLTIENLGPSDAAKVVLYDWPPTDATFQLPPDVVANQIFTPTNDIPCMLRDDGLLLCLVGNDANNEGTNQRGRLNAGSVLTMTFAVQVDPSPTPRQLTNTATVVTVAEDEYPFALGETSDDPIEPADFLDGTTPTADPSTDNNTYTETTTVLTGRVAVDKKAYVNRSEARGIDIPTDPIYGNLTAVERCAVLAQDDILVLPGDEIVYCYTITNPGETWLRSITLQDAPNGFEWLNLSDFGVIYPDLSLLRGTITLDPATPAINQTINISTTHNTKAVLAPAGVEDDYQAIIITRTVTVDFPELGPISGVVWQDDNGNGAVDLTYEPPPDAVQPEPLQAAGTAVDLLDQTGAQVLDSTTTDADGRYVFHDVEPGKYIVRVLGDSSEVFEFDPAKGYSTANFDSLESRWYIETNLSWIDTTFRVLGNNRAGVSALPSTKYSTELPGVPLVYNSDLLHDTLALPVLEDTTKDWSIYHDDDGDSLPSPQDVIEYTVIMSNTGAIEATGVRLYDGLYNYIADNPLDPRVPARLINGSVSAALHVAGRDPVTGREIDADVAPPDLAFGEDLLLRTQAPGVDLTYDSAIVLPEEIILGNNDGDDEVFVYTRLKIPPQGWLVRFGGVTYDPPIPVTFSLRVRYQVRIKENVACGDTVVLNQGWVDYNEIDLFDQRFPNFNPAGVNQFLDANKAANNHAGTTGRAYWNREFPGWPAIPEGFEPTNYPGARFDDYALPGAALRDDDDPTWYVVTREAGCRGVDWRLQLPALDTVDCETWIQVQNVGDRYTKAALVIWGDPGPCPPQSAGPLKVECSGLLRPGSAWTWINNQLPAGAKSGILYSLNATDTVTDGRGNQINFADFACLVLGRSIVGDYEEWLLFDTAYRNEGIYYAYSRGGDGNQDVDILDFDTYSGEPTTVSVNRACPGDNTPSVDVHAAYTAFSTDQEGFADPVAGGYAYYAPLLWATYGAPPDDLSTIMHIQNSGTECTSVEIWFQAQDNCLRYTVGDILALAPGEAYQFDPNTVVGPNWQGSAWIASSHPLGVLVDIIGRDLFGSYRAVPADSYVGYGDEDFPVPFTLGSLVNYAPLTYREYNGWDTGIQVQNLSSTANAKVKVYFTDNSGDIITTIVDWICPRGSQTFLLAAVANLPGSYVGSARIESQDWWSPGDPGVDGPFIQSVVNTVKYQDLTRAMPLELMAYNALQEPFGFDWQLGREPGIETLGVPLVARGNRGVTSELAIQNLNPNPGFTDFAIFIYDQNRLIDFVCQKLNEKQTEYIDMDLWGVIPRGFLGSVVVQAQFTTQAGGTALGAVAVERVGRTLSDPDLPGDESKAFEAFPLWTRYKVEPDVQCPGAP